MCDFLCKDTHIPAIKQQVRHRKCRKLLWGVEKLGVLNWKTRRAELKKSACRIGELGEPSWRSRLQSFLYFLSLRTKHFMQSDRCSNRETLKATDAMKAIAPVVYRSSSEGETR